MFEGSVLEKRSLEISRLARRIIKRIKRAVKRGQPRGKLRKKKKTILQVHEKPVIHPHNIPEDAVFKGFNRYTVQEISFKSHNIQYQLARWQLSDGSYITGELPKDVQGHYGCQLITYILHQYHGCRVTEHLLLDQLHAMGILISAGQLNNILIENKEAFIEEVAELLPVAARIEKQVQVDDTGGRHNGQNQYTTIIGNRWFSIFATTDSKSRINFLKLLQGGQEEYVINEDTLEFREHKIDHVIETKEPEFFLMVTGITKDEFKALCDLGFINQQALNRIVREFRCQEESSLSPEGYILENMNGARIKQGN